MAKLADLIRSGMSLKEANEFLNQALQVRPLELTEEAEDEGDADDADDAAD